MSLYEDLLDKMSGKEYVGYFAAHCVFEEHVSAALMVYEESYTQSWEFRCLSCGRHGSLEFLAKKLRVSVPLTQSQPSQVLPRWKEWDRQYGGLDGIARHAHESLLRYPQFQSYFKKRRIHAFIEKGFFGYCEGWGILPVFSDNGYIVDIVVRSISNKGNSRYVVSSIGRDGNSSRNLYVPNWQRVQEEKVVYVVMGMIDSWSLETIGLPCVTGVTGKAIPVDRLRELKKKLIIIPDEGEEEDAHRIANEFGMGARVRTLKYPSSCKDVDEVRMKYGKDYLSQLIGV